MMHFKGGGKKVLFHVKLVHIKTHGTEIAKLLLIYTSYGFIPDFFVNMSLEEQR